MDKKMIKRESDQDSDDSGRDREEDMDESTSKDKSGNPPSDKKLARSERRKKYYENLLVKRKENRKLERQAWKQRMKELPKSDVKKLTRKEREEIRLRCEEAMRSGQKICIDCGLEELMSEKEKGKLAIQVGRMYGSNKKAEKPAHIYLTGLQQQGELYQQMKKKNDGFTKYLIDCRETSYEELFPLDQIVYLSPDSDNLLSEVDPKKVYIMGGLVDEGIKKNVSLKAAEKQGIATARLPIDEHMDRTIQGTYSKVLAINQVFDILQAYLATSCWKEALLAGIPQRKGFVAKKEGEKDPKQ